MADEQSKIDKKAEKARKREAKKMQKMQKNGKLDTDILEEEEEGGKLAVFFVTVVILVIWLAILVLLIKWDVGGFGSTVMTPILKNVPYVNKILPESDEIISTETELPYKTLGEAVAYIKELELELEVAQKSSNDSSAYSAQLEEQLKKLKEYEANEAEFEAIKEKFYKEVVFSDSAPDISVYREYYESIDPANAEILYKQVVAQEQIDAEMEDFVSTYSKMKPKEAAAIFDTMTSELDLVAEILENLSAQARGDILGKMNTETAAKVINIMNPSE